MAGRPRKEIDKDNFEKLCGLLCTEEEIASFFDCSADTIERWCKRTYKANFAEVYKSKCQNGKIALRRYQFKLAEKYPVMAIWLGKQWLGQRDKFEDVDTSALEKLDAILKRTQEQADAELFEETT